MTGSAASTPATYAVDGRAAIIEDDADEHRTSGTCAASDGLESVGVMVHRRRHAPLARARMCPEGNVQYAWERS